MLLQKETLDKFGYTIESLSNGSNKKVVLQCDYCQGIYESSYKQYNNAHNIIDKDACIKCKYKKRADISMKLYGVANSAQRSDVRAKISENCAFKQEGFKEKRAATMMEKYGVVNAMENQELRDKYKKSVQNKYGVDNISQNEDVKAKRRNTNRERFGNEQFLASQEGRRRAQEGVREKYGVDNVFQAEEIKEKIRQTNLENLGVEMPTQSKEIMDKIEKTNIERYGYKSPSQNEQVKEKAVSTNLERYGYKNPQQSPEIKAKIRQKAIDKGRIKLYNGKDKKTLAKEMGIPYTTFVYHSRLYGMETATKMTPQISSLEQVVKTWLDSENIKYDLHFTINKRKSDFLLNDYNIIIELDGLYWHSDLFRPDDYHIKKHKVYIQNGYTPIFFREDEVNNKFEIVKSVILNKMRKSKRVFARKCKIVKMLRKEAQKFCNENHLMGQGKGKAYGLEYNGEIVSCIVIKQLKDKHYEISRFCHQLGYQISGGYSRLINHFLKNHDVDLLTTFVDRRYGSGDYLTGLGFEFIACKRSFRWTNSRECVHRMKFPKNTGYDYGFVKIWDCGQARYDMKVVHDTPS